MKPSDPLLLTDDTLCCGMYPAGKVAISRQEIWGSKYYSQCPKLNMIEEN